MADSKISALAAATSLAGTDEFVIATGGASKKVTMATLLASLPMVLIHDSTLGADAASFDIQSIPATYKHLLCLLSGRGDTAATTVAINARFNNDSGANYDRLTGGFASAGTVVSSAAAGTSGRVGLLAGSTATANRSGSIRCQILDYAGTTFNKVLRGEGMVHWGTAAADMQMEHDLVNWRSTAAINRITLTPNAGNFIIGSRLTIYGLN